MYFAPAGPVAGGPSSQGGGSKGNKGKAYDIEALDEPLYPHITTSEQGLRWGFIQKARVLGRRAGGAG